MFVHLNVVASQCNIFWPGLQKIPAKIPRLVFEMALDIPWFVWQSWSVLVEFFFFNFPFF